MRKPYPEHCEGCPCLKKEKSPIFDDLYSCGLDIEGEFKKTCRFRDNKNNQQKES